MVDFANPKFSNIARPYALAAFEFARDHQQLATWKVFLESGALVAANESVIKFLSNPEVLTQQAFDLFHDVLQRQVDKDRRNFLLLLAEKKRLIVLAEISVLFNQYFAALEKQSTVRVVTAVDIDDNFRQKLIQALNKRTQREVSLHCEVDPSIIGGAIIRIGDRVIDGSIRGKLARLLEFLR